MVNGLALLLACVYTLYSLHPRKTMKTITANSFFTHIRLLWKPGFWCQWLLLSVDTLKHNNKGISIFYTDLDIRVIRCIDLGRDIWSSNFGLVLVMMSRKLCVCIHRRNTAAYTSTLYKVPSTCMHTPNRKKRSRKGNHGELHRFLVSRLSRSFSHPPSSFGDSSLPLPQADFT